MIVKKQKCTQTSNPILNVMDTTKKNILCKGSCRKFGFKIPKVLSMT